MRPAHPALQFVNNRTVRQVKNSSRVFGLSDQTRLRQSYTSPLRVETAMLLTEGSWVNILRNPQVPAGTFGDGPHPRFAHVQGYLAQEKTSSPRTL